MFPEELGFYPAGHQGTVHTVDRIPCEFSLATLHGHGLRDHDLTKASATMLRQKIKAREEQESNWPYARDELIQQLDKGPLTKKYNVIFASVDPCFKTNEYGYAIAISRPIATNIWLLACEWQSLFTKGRTRKQTVAGMTIQHTTGSKEVLSLLHKLNNTISYNDVRMQNRAWEKMVSVDGPKIIVDGKKIPTHAMIDNNDGGQEKITGRGRTHNSNRTLFQPVLLGTIMSISDDALLHS